MTQKIARTLSSKNEISLDFFDQRMKIMCRFIQMQDHKIKKIILDQQQFIIAQFSADEREDRSKLTKINEKTTQNLQV
jgi:hypothetical protein